MGIYKKGKNWYIDYYVNGKRKRELVGPSKSLAEHALRKRKIEIAEGKFLDVKKQEKIRFSDFARTYLETHAKPNKRSWKRDADIIETLNRFFNQKTLQEITPFDVENYKRERLFQVKPATVNRDLACLKTIFSKAVEWGKVKENPVKRVKLLRVNNIRVRYLETEEMANLLKNCSEPLYTIVTVALNTGMRKSEILNLKWSELDCNHRLIYLMETKSGNSREVPMNNIVFSALLKVRKNPKGPYIFCDKYGQPFQDVKTSFHTALKKTEIENFTFHDLRHTFASQLVMMGADLKTVQELLGHKTFQMTLRYAHLSPSHKKAAVDRFASRMDTIWTPEVETENSENGESLDTVGSRLRDLNPRPEHYKCPALPLS